MAAVRKAAGAAMAQGYLLQSDHDALIAAAEASNVLSEASIAVGLGASTRTAR